MANTGANAGVPTSGAIGLTNFYGATRVGPLSVNANDVSGDSWPGTGSIFGTGFASPSGGTPPYTYAWTNISGSTYTLGTPSGQSTTFARAGNPPQGSAASGVYRVTVTDAALATAFKNITVADSRA